MLFQTRKTFVHLRNTNEDIFDEFRELSDPPIDIKDPNKQCWGKLLLKVMHYNIALLPKKVTNYVT